MRRLELSVYVLLAAATAAGPVLTVVHASDEVYAIPGYGVAIAAGAAVMAAIRGRLEGDDYVLTYTCRDDELSGFELRDR